MLQNDDGVFDRLRDRALLCDPELRFPVLAVLRRLAEVRRGFAHAVGNDLRLDALVPARKLRHGAVARAAAHRCIRAALAVQLTEAVQPHKIPGVAQLPARRVCAVVGKAEFVVIDHNTGGGAALGIGIAPGIVAGPVGGHELGDGVLNAVRPAERAYDAALLQRVLLLGSALSDDLRHAAAHGPAGHVAPVVVGGKHRVGVKKRPVRVPEYKRRVLAAARPVHHALRLVARVVKLVDAQRGGDAPSDRLVLVAVHVARERHHEAVPRLLGRVLVRGVDRRGVAVQQLPVAPQVIVREVRVQTEDRAEADVGAAAVVAVAADEPAHVLDLALLLAGHGLVLRHGLRRARNGAQPVQQLRPPDGLVLPRLGLPAVAQGDVQRLVILDVHRIAPPLFSPSYRMACCSRRRGAAAPAPSRSGGP